MNDTLQIIDFQRKGNVIKLYLGKNGEQWGDDWNDRPYDSNAGVVYDEYVKDTVEISIEFDSDVLEPCDGELNCHYSKEDMINRVVPCFIIVPQSVKAGHWFDENFYHWCSADGILRVYFGDTLNDLIE